MWSSRPVRPAALLAFLMLALGLWLIFAIPSKSASIAWRESLKARRADTALDRALVRLTAGGGGPLGVGVLVQRGPRAVLHRAGSGDLATSRPIKASDRMRLASVSKAFSGAVALSLVAGHTLSLTDTVGRWLPRLPAAWSAVTLRELLQHTGGIPDFSSKRAFQEALVKSLLIAPPPDGLLSYVAHDRLEFTPGSQFHYSNSDNIIVALMIEAATGQSYEAELRERVFVPLGLPRTSLPRDARIRAPYVHGYEADSPRARNDVTELFAAGWSWASGGIVSTLQDANRFVRAYVRGATTDRPTRAAQFQFVAGSSEPPGPGKNSVGLGIFRYQTRCGTVYGHTGNTSGYTQFIAASADGARSVVVSINGQLSPKVDRRLFAELRAVYALAVCAALA
jgi:D-alanyl-D-alanine carboxypeptidase